MSYSRTTWIPEETPLSADNFNNIEDGIEESLNRLDAIASNTELFNAIYPIGSIYMSTSSTNPSAYFGGTWVAWGSGRVPVGVNASDTSFNTVEKTGGIKDAVLPSHSHTASFTGTAVADHRHTSPSHTHTVSGSTGGAGSHSHTPGDSSHVFLRSETGQSVGRRTIKNGTGTEYTNNVYAAGAIGNLGATNTVADHSHSVSLTSGYGGEGLTSAAGGHTPSGTVTVASNGVSGANQNLQPYITCYMWKRTA